MDDQTQMLLQRLPGVDRLLDCARHSETLRQAPHSVLRNAARTALEALRHQLLKGIHPLTPGIWKKRPCCSASRPW